MICHSYANGLVFKFINRTNVHLKRIDPFVCLFVCLFVFLFVVCLFVCLFVCPKVSNAENQAPTGLGPR